MAFVSPRMSLKVWNSAQDAYSHEQLADNFLKLDQHDHSSGKGTVITGSGIADGSIEARHIYPGTLTPAFVTSELDTRYLPEFRTTLPGSPTDGQEIYYRASDSLGVIWHLRYRSASASAYKWECVGGGSLTNLVSAQQALASLSTWQDLATVGPSITIPLAGDYIVHAGAWSYRIGSGTKVLIFGYTDGTTPGIDDRATIATTFTTGNEMAWNQTVVNRNTFAAGAVVKMRYYGSGVTAANFSFASRVLDIRPIRVG